METKKYTPNENENENERNYYSYRGKHFMTSEPEKDLLNYSNIHICAYTINNDGKYPFQRFLLVKEPHETELRLPNIPLLKIMGVDEFLNFAKVVLFGMMMLPDYELYNEQLEFNGFYEFDNNLYLFFDISKCNIQICDIYSTSFLWLALVDEIINYKNLCNIPINIDVTRLLEFNCELYFLTDENDNIYEIPILSYVGKPENKLNLTYVFGESAKDKSSLLGPHYYFTDFVNAVREGCNNDNEISEVKYGAYKKGGIVRFAIFQGLTKYVENHPNDPIDESDTKKQRLDDALLDINMERLTMRISDHHGKWSQNYDSTFLGDIELDNGTHMKNVPMLVVKDYKQQIPLSYHYVRKTIPDDLFNSSTNYKIL